MRRGSLFIAMVLCLLGSQARAAAPIPEGSALWFACTEPFFSGPAALRCPQPYDPRYRTTFLRGFSRFTPENEFKMNFLEPAQDQFDFSLADQVAAFAQANGKTIRGHTLVWDEELPNWVKYPLLPWSHDELLGIMRNYISKTVSHFAVTFPGIVTEWDVVNEPLTPQGTLMQSPWELTIGPEYIADALVAAHSADPHARLLINEDGADGPGSVSMPLLSLATSLKRAGVPLDAVGFEAHVTPHSAPSLGYLLWLMHRYAQVGLKVEITELDVNNDGLVDDPVAKAAVFRRYALACRLAGNCGGLTVWGVADHYSWLGPFSDALLYDADFHAKPEASAVRTILSSRRAAVPRRRARHEGR